MSQLKITFFLILLLTTTTSLVAQKMIYPEKLFQKRGYYWDEDNFHGNVKKVTIKNYAYTFSKKDSIYTEHTTSDYEKDIFIDFNEIKEFDKRGRLLKLFYVKRDGTTFLEKENSYTRKGKLRHQVQQDLAQRRINGKDSVHVHLIHELRSYTIYCELKEVWMKSSFQDEYFIKERYTYSDKNLLLKKESFNSNVRTEANITCKGSSVDTDYIKLYTYDANNRLIEQNVYAYEYNLGEDNYTVIKHRDFSKYKLHKVITFEYDERDLIVKEVRKHFGGYLQGAVNIITRKYDQKNRLIEDMTIHTAGHGYGHIYEYHEKDGVLEKIVSIYTQKKKGVNTILKTIGSIRKKKEDGFISVNFSNGRREQIIHYNTYEDKTLTINPAAQKKNVFQYSYDTYGNWTSRTLLENGIKKEKVVRTFEYY
jgi:hypothetical protein